ncbi:MAG: hypothetical protein JRG86_13695 [Deltaproteobacteria bacterium]|nr:hypothetical protein [Deltaproteobacteria bacterium]
MIGTVFIHTNHRQMVGALVSQHSLKRNSTRPDDFDVQLIHTRDHPFLAEREGQEYLRDGVTRTWRMDDLQSFTPLRFMPPQLMGFEGRAIVIDPDIFAAGDVTELLERDMQGKSILARKRSGAKGRAGIMASSVMLLDCAKLRHWDVPKTFGEMFAYETDYMDWIGLKLEDPATLGPLEPEWNDFDRLTPETRLIHNTKRWTQPWKTGLPVDFVPAEKTRAFAPLGWYRRARRALLGDYAGLGRYRAHPDPAQERFFFSLLRECVEEGIVSEDFLRDEMAHNHVRHDAFELIEKAPQLAPA